MKKVHSSLRIVCWLIFLSLVFGAMYSEELKRILSLTKSDLSVTGFLAIVLWIYLYLINLIVGAIIEQRQIEKLGKSIKKLGETQELLFNTIHQIRG